MRTAFCLVSSDLIEAPHVCTKRKFECHAYPIVKLTLYNCGIFGERIFMIKMHLTDEKNGAIIMVKQRGALFYLWGAKPPVLPKLPKT